MSDRQIVLDTETTGLEYRQGHRIIEIGCVELVNRKLTGNNYHVYLNPEREIDLGAIEVHGITNEFLSDKPLFLEIYQTFLDYVKNSELIIHNAPFDVGFLNAELKKIGADTPQIEDLCEVHDTLFQARKRFPGQRNDLDSLCKRYEVNNTHRELHGALLDAEILADVYLCMTGGQTDLSLDAETGREEGAANGRPRVDFSKLELLVSKASPQEAEDHVEWLTRLDESVEGQCVWTRLNNKNGAL
jgi:DNA polymerase-3 subunit epsilon